MGTPFVLYIWENIVHRPLMNAMQICLAGDVFFDSLNTTRNTKDTDYVAIEVKLYIVVVVPTKVLQICIDNATAMKSVASIIS